jgi:hypothetical protein
LDYDNSLKLEKGRKKRKAKKEAKKGRQKNKRGRRKNNLNFITRTKRKREA